jgi:FkbM family methyltransferase
VRRLRRIGEKAWKRLVIGRRALTQFDDDWNRTKLKPSYAERGEDLIAWSLFAQLRISRPTYLDVGAHDPELLSNTALFYLLGARGMNIEPDPARYAAFPAARPGDLNLNIGLGDADELRTFYCMQEPLLNTFSQVKARRIAANQKIPIVREIPLAVRRIRTVMEEHAFCPDFLSIDTQGTELEILADFHFEHRRPKVICANTLSFCGGKNSHLIDFIIGRGYRLYADTHINTIFVDAALVSA